jgi:CheY-like chemotaxis protein
VSAPGAAVLVVEDDDETRTVLVRELRARGYRIQEAVDGASGAMP